MSRRPARTPDEAIAAGQVGFEGTASAEHATAERIARSVLDVAGALVEGAHDALRPRVVVVSVTTADGLGHTAWSGTLEVDLLHAAALDITLSAALLIAEESGLPEPVIVLPICQAEGCDELARAEPVSAWAEADGHLRVALRLCLAHGKALGAWRPE